jgi:hypothetical protein
MPIPVREKFLEIANMVNRELCEMLINNYWQKIITKNIVKAIMPYGFLWLYGKIKKENRNKKRGIIKPLTKHLLDSPQFIVSLTSHGRRIHTKVQYAIHSLFNQTVQPDRIVLWLAHETKIPKKLKKMQDAGLEIYFCDDIGSFTKLIPALINFPNDVIITADDDVYYHRDWFKILKEAYNKDPPFPLPLPLHREYHFTPLAICQKVQLYIDDIHGKGILCIFTSKQFSALPFEP